MPKPKTLSLAEWMTDHGLYDQQISDAIGITRPYINRIRNGEVHPNLETALLIWNFTNREIAIEELLPKAKRPSSAAKRVVPVAQRGRPQKLPVRKASKSPEAA